LAVLLMVFAALLGATMITVVSANLSQTSRQGGLAAASTASIGAFSFLNDRLTNSLQAERWRPWQSIPPPSPGTSDFNLYYSAYERAKGWVNEVDFAALQPTDHVDNNANGVFYDDAIASGNTQEQESERVAFVDNLMLAGARCFVKFPDPRGAATNAGGPQYLAEVAPQADGLLRLTVIGQSEDEPGAFDVRTAFKPTLARSGPFSFSRFDSNYSYKDKSQVRTRLRTPATTAVLQVESTLGLEAGRTVIVGDDPATAQSALVMDVSVAARTVTLTSAVTAPSGASVAAASPLMDGIRNQDFDADAAPDNVKGDANAWEQTLAPQRRAARGIMINGGATLEGKATLTLGGSNTSNTDDDDTLSVAGLIAPRPAAPVDEAMLATPDPTPLLATLPDSNDARTDALQSLVRDNRGGQSSRIQPLTPPNIDGANSRYRELTQFANVAAGSGQGYGPGVYIDNISDVEKKTVGTQRVALPLFESQRLFARKYLSYGPPVAGGTLEERHLRGWVSPWEFRARGVLIELRGDSIVFTRDDRSDATTGPLLNLPDSAKAWKQPGGAMLVAPGANTFRMVLDITNGKRSFGAPGAEVDEPGPIVPFNGLIMAEGNARVRGFLGSRDITIVSMSNIFIEGSLVRDRNNPTAPPATARRLALLARRNVVLNPTLWPAPLAGAQDRDVAAVPAQLVAPATSGDTTITVDNPDALRVGDEVHVGSDNLWHMVTQISGAELTLATGLGVDAALNDPVRRLSDPSLATAGSETFYELGAGGGVFARDVRLDGIAPPSTYTLSWLHAGGRVEALQLRRSGGGAGSFNVKENTTASTPEVISGSTTNEKTFTASGGASQDLLDIDADGSQEGDAIETLQELKNRFDNADPSLDNPNWEVNLAPGQDAVAARRLAAVGAEAGAGDDATIDAGAAHSVPLALSGGWFFQPGWNPGAASLVPTPVPTATAPVPWQVIGTSAMPDGDDDLDTTREIFYQRGPGASPTQASLRWRSAVLPSAPDVLASNVASFLHEPGLSAGTLPAYHLGPFKIERDDFAAASGAFDAVPLYVQATIFAEEGSWFVIAPPMGVVPDINNDGDTTEAEDIAASTRYRRLNYEVTVTGTIAQNFAPTAMLDYDGTPGLMRGWIDALSRPTNIEDNGSGQGRGRDWQAIEYQADAVPPNSGLYLPPTPDLVYVN
jgi:hypothetical protein